MVKWAVGLRLPEATNKAVQAAVDDGKIIRTHVLRPTWHLVSSNDIRWMLELTAPRIKTAMKSRHKELGLTSGVVAKSKNLLKKVLRDENHLTRNELKVRFTDAGIEIDRRMSHLLLRAELDGVICSGRSKGKSQTYALLDERAPARKIFTRDEALAELARRYFRGHGPATIDDFSWWSGLTLTDSRKALKMVTGSFISETIDSKTYWFSDSLSLSEMDKSSVHLLPAFDEFIVSYTDRSAALPVEHNQKAVSKNGVFWPVILVNGQVAGLWKRMERKTKVNITLEPFEPLSKPVVKLIKEKAATFGNFLGKKAAM